jgi:hypothetical protein
MEIAYFPVVNWSRTNLGMGPRRGDARLLQRFGLEIAIDAAAIRDLLRLREKEAQRIAHIVLAPRISSSEIPFRPLLHSQIPLAFISGNECPVPNTKTRRRTDFSATGDGQVIPYQPHTGVIPLAIQVHCQTVRIGATAT